MWRGLCLGAIAFGLLCGWTLDDSPRQKASATPAQCAPPRSLETGQAKKYRSNCMLCALVGEKAIASTYGLTGTGPAALAAGYARKTAPPGYREAVADGCLRGLHLGGPATTRTAAAPAGQAQPESTPAKGDAGGNGGGNGNPATTPPGQETSNGKGNAGGR